MKVELKISVQFENKGGDLKKGDFLNVLSERGNTVYCQNPNWAGTQGFWISKNDVKIV